jgi:uncharacterized membrane protein YfcA
VATRALPLVGTGLGLTLTPITATVMSRVPPQRAGMASATSNTARELGGAVVSPSSARS